MAAALLALATILTATVLLGLLPPKAPRRVPSPPAFVCLPHTSVFRIKNAWSPSPVVEKLACSNGWFQEMLDRLLGNGIRTILVETASRFARDLIVQETGFEMLKARGIDLIAVDSPDSFVADTRRRT